MKRESLVAFAVLGGAALFLLSRKSAAAEAQGAAASMLTPPAELPGSAAPTTAALTAAGTFWDTLTPVNAIASGYVELPSGAEVPAAEFSAGLTRTDAAGNYFIQWGGETYRIGDMDAQGNWPATLAGV